MLRLTAYFFSVLFHPLMIITYMILIMLMVDPYMFGVHSVEGGMLEVIRAFASTFFIPAIAVMMMKALGFVSSFEMKDPQERIGPYIVTGIFYLAYFYAMYRNPDMPRIYVAFLLGSVVGLFLAFFLNLFSKISAHGVGMGGLLGMVLITVFRTKQTTFMIQLGGAMEISLNTLLILTIIFCGIVGTSRLLLNAHEPKDLYGGFLVGIATQFIALNILL